MLRNYPNIYTVSQMKWRQNSNPFKFMQRNWTETCHFKHTNCYLLNVNYTSFRKIRNLVSVIWNFKSLTCVNAHWLLDVCQWRLLGGWSQMTLKMKERKFIDNKVHRFGVFHCGLHTAVNHLRPIPLLKTIQTCWIHAAASYTKNDVLSTFLLILCFSVHKGEQVLLKF